MIADAQPSGKSCVDLRQRFGDRYRVEYDESYYAEYGPRAWTEDPQFQVIPCQHGDICPWGGSQLAACTKRAGIITNRLRALSFVEVVQDGDDGINAVFDVAYFDRVAGIMKPRRRRRLSPEARRAAGERLRKYQFKPAVEAADGTPGCDGSRVVV